MKEFQRNLNAIVIHTSNTDLGGNSNSNLLIFNVIGIVIYYIDIGSDCNSNSNILHCIVIDPMSDVSTCSTIYMYIIIDTLH